MPKKLELAGQRFGMLHVLAEAGRDRHGAVLWRAKCDCQKETMARGSQLLSGVTTSCGCGISIASSRPRKHGKCKTPLFRVWMGMKARCSQPNNRAFQNYGGRGILVCAQWMDFAAFEQDMATNYRPGLEIERIDNNGNYEPGNCRWATRKEQTLNTRRNHYINWQGTRLPLALWAERAGLSPNTLLYRLRRGWSIDRAMTTPPAPRTSRSVLLEIANR